MLTGLRQWPVPGVVHIEDPKFPGHRIQIGQNPEHSRLFTPRDMYESDFCEHGHYGIMERWVMKALAYQEEPDAQD